MQKKTLILAITGASGAIYARKILQGLSTSGCRVYLVISPAGRRLLHDELGVEHPDPDGILGESVPHDIIPLPYNDIGACIASGSYKTNGMVVAPCSSNKLAEISRGLGDNLIGRAAQVTLKERRPLILLHREMPIGLIELRNMCQLAEAGAIICPASPGFYKTPQSIDDLVTMVAGRVLDLLDVPHDWNTRWTGAGARSDPGEGSGST
ncbi:MAG: UbiX family flavin prenyltransferase [Phycisphaerae bacterium]